MRSILTASLCALLWCEAAGAADVRQVCVLVPHFKDEYWLSVGFGLEREAARQKARLVFHEAGGYRARAAQIAQLRACAAGVADAILIGAVTSDHPDLVEAVNAAAQEVPVFALVNALHAEGLSGRVGVDWHDMGLAVGRHLAERHPAGSAPRSAIVLSGPPEAGWSGPLEKGVRAGLANSAVRIAALHGDDTGLREQLALLETALAQHPDADYLIGSAPAIEAAMGLKAGGEADAALGLVSTYISHTVLRGLKGGRVEAAPFDDPMMQGVMAIRRVLVGAGWRAASGADQAAEGPSITLLTARDSPLDAVRLSPADYFPAIQ